MHIGYKEHHRNGDVWRGEVELLMQDSPEDEPFSLFVRVDVIAPNSDLAKYILTTMYPDYESIYVHEDPL